MHECRRSRHSFVNNEKEVRRRIEFLWTQSGLSVDFCDISFLQSVFLFLLDNAVQLSVVRKTDLDVHSIFYTNEMCLTVLAPKRQPLTRGRRKDMGKSESSYHLVFPFRLANCSMYASRLRRDIC